MSQQLRQKEQAVIISSCAFMPLFFSQTFLFSLLAFSFPSWPLFSFYFTHISSALLIYFLSQCVSPSLSDPPLSCPALTRLALTSVLHRLHLQKPILLCPIVSFCTFLSTFNGVDPVLFSAVSYLV